MNTQEIFNTVVNHLRKQGTRYDINWTYQSSGAFNNPYVNELNPCQRCAKGILMNAIHAIKSWKISPLKNFYYYDEDLHSKHAFSWKKEVEYNLKKELSQKEVELLTKLECIFELNKKSDWEGLFEKAANQYGLIYKPIDTKKYTIENVNYA